MTELFNPEARSLGSSQHSWVGEEGHRGPRGFMGGFRSGTTLLINLLGLHPDVATWYETKFLPEALRWMRVIRCPYELREESLLCAPPHPPGFALGAVTHRMILQMEYDEARLRGQSPSGKREYEVYPLGADRIHYPLKVALGALTRWQGSLNDTPDLAMLSQATRQLVLNLAEYQLAIEPAPLLINKTPELPRFGWELRACLGACKIILVIRDGREVVRSAASLGWAEPARLAYLWRELILQSRQAATGAPHDYLEVRYEDLVTDPIQVVDQVCGFLEISPLGSRIVSDYQRQAGIPIGPSALSPAAPSLSVAPEGAGIAEITWREAGDLLSELGYRR